MPGRKARTRADSAMNNRTVLTAVICGLLFLGYSTAVWFWGRASVKPVVKTERVVEFKTQLVEGPGRVEIQYRDRTIRPGADSLVAFWRALATQLAAHVAALEGEDPDSIPVLWAEFDTTQHLKAVISTPGDSVIIPTTLELRTLVRYGMPINRFTLETSPSVLHIPAELPHAGASTGADEPSWLESLWRNYADASGIVVGAAIILLIIKLTTGVL